MSLNNPAQFDLAALAIVRPGVEGGLLEISKHLAAFWAEPAKQSAAILFAQGEAKRLAGVFKMIGLEGLAVYCTEIEAVFAELASHPTSATTVFRDGVDAGLSALAEYLEDISQGVDNATLRLFSRYQQLQYMRGLETSFELDLFFPNLNVALPNSVLEPLQASNPQAQLKAARGQYQQALLKYLRQLDVSASLQSMRQAMLGVMTALPADEQRAYWWVAAGFFDCLGVQNVATGFNVSKLLGRVDQQMRALLDAKSIEQQPELYQMLYVIAHQEVVLDDLPAAINKTYALQRYIQTADSISPSLLSKRLTVIAEHLKRAQESWESCATGTSTDCANFISQASLIEQYCEKLDRDTLQVLARSIAKYAQYVSEPENAALLGLDMAMSLLLLDRGLVSYHQVDDSFQKQALMLSERMHDAVNNSSGQERPITDLVDLYCSHESLLVRTLLSKEMLANLQRVEAGINSFFEDASKRHELLTTKQDIQQIQGGLHILGGQAAAALSDAFQQTISRLAKSTLPCERGESRAIATALSILERSLSNLPHPGRDQEVAVLTACAELDKLNRGNVVQHDATVTLPKLDMSVGAKSNEDFELIEIFLEEADEVLGIMRDNLELCHLHEVNYAPLVTIRRGYHTLKGSGRMVGLNELGEVAWALERAMNTWLKNEQPVSLALIKMIEMSIPQFGIWVDSLHRQLVTKIEATELLAAAQQIETQQASETLADEIVPTAELPAAPLVDIDPIEALEIEEPVLDDIAPLPLEFTPAAVELIEVESVEAEALNQVQVGTITLSGALFKIGSEESTQHVATLHEQFARLSAAVTPQIEYDFMRAAHTLAGVNRAMGFAAIVELAFALESWLQARIEHPFKLQAGQLELLSNAIATLDRMVQILNARQFPKASSDLVYLLNMDKDKLHVEQAAPAEAVLVSPPLLQLVVNSAPVEQPVAAESKPLLAPLIRDEVDEQLLPIFVEEADDLVPQIGANLRAWRGAPADTKHVQLLNRLLHTLKGSARMAGAMRIGQVAHEMEDAVLDADKRQQESAYWDELDHEFDRITALLEELRTGKSAAISVDIADVRHRASDQADSVTAPDRRVLEVGAERALQGNMLRVRADVIDRLVNEASEISVARARMEGELRAFKDGLIELTESVVRLRKQVREVEIQAESQMQARVSLVQDSDEKFDPLEFDRFTRLQELTRFMNESVHDVQTVQQALLKNLDETTAAMSAQARLNRELQQSLMNVRMVPFNSVTDRLYRIVRQTGKELNKRANLELSGTAVELDRSVLEKMTAPFEHLMRNAMAHGLESEQQRNQLGKQPIGEIRLSVQQANNEVVFELSDDGAGLNFAGLRDKAIKQGLMQAQDVASDEQLAQLIFSSGISTATKVTEVAGRGIGMDVVRSEITALGGRIDVTSSVGKGTKFVIHLPLTLAVTQVLMVRCGETTYAIPSVMVEQVRQIKAAEMEEFYRAGELEWQGKHYPLHYLPKLLGTGNPVAETQVRNAVLLLRSGEARMALHIEELLGNQEAVVKNIGPQLARLAGVAGATVRGNGGVVLILNPLQISQSLFVNAGSKVVVEAVRRLPLVMVVDDSLTVRKITTRMLTRAGYEVVTAKDGIDALEQLTDVMPDVMLLDVEMPRMDGFELTKRLRQDNKTKQLPIIMITSRTADKHREHAEQLGVNAYLGKPYQEDDLLVRIAGFITAA